MSYHVSNSGAYGAGLHTDIDGYIPDSDTGPWDLRYDHGCEETHTADGTLTEYGEWWEDERFPEILAEAIAATQAAEVGIADWRGGEA